MPEAGQANIEIAHHLNESHTHAEHASLKTEIIRGRRARTGGHHHIGGAVTGQRVEAQGYDFTTD